LSSSFEDFGKENIPETTQLKQAVFPELCTSAEIRATSPNESKIFTNFQCDLCLKTFSTKAHLRRHIEAHSGLVIHFRLSLFKFHAHLDLQEIDFSIVIYAVKAMLPNKDLQRTCLGSITSIQERLSHVVKKFGLF
jgi:hypothetical protein